MDSSTPSPRSPPPSKIEPYRGSCPNCQHGTMFPLERFHESDVRDNATVDAAVLSRRDAWFAPGFAVTVMMVSWLANLTWDRGRVERGRIKVRKGARRSFAALSPRGDLSQLL